MSTTVLVTFRAKPGRGAELLRWLQRFHPQLRGHAGFERITIYQEQESPDVVVELEQWRDGADHRAMVAAVDREGGWDPMSALLASPPETRYLRAESGLTAT
jgi:quinol monooxygenase YgiN